jgi:D-beta-D-heptose 7-phosphate kinase/D-beta-D-heptose 1-phosphate adenosyltransferase
MNPVRRAAVFLDRDGTLIEDVGYPRNPTQVRLLPGVAEALLRLRGRGQLLVVVSNQSGLGRGVITSAEARSVAERMEQCLSQEGVQLDASYYCPHGPEEGCSCRKPEAGLLRRAAEEWGIDLDRSYFVGDKSSDIEAGRRAGCRTVLLAGNRGIATEAEPDYAAVGWREAADWILDNIGRPVEHNSLLRRFQGRRVLVVGDVMLDEYLWGKVRRISPEAPVPVVELERRSHAPGGAANAAANAAGLGAEVFLAGVRGDDLAGQRLHDSLRGQGIRLEGLLVDAARPTTTKTRVIAHAQQVLRIDEEQPTPLPEPLEQRLARFAEDCLDAVDVCVLSDYAKGILSTALTRRVIDKAARLGKPVVVDPKGPDPAPYRGATLVKPNLQEATLLWGREPRSPEEIAAAGGRLLELLDAAAVLLTRGPAGMTLFRRGQEAVHVPAQAREVFDVTGAGDTVTASAALALAVGADAEQAARLASLAAAVIVGRVGTVPITLAELAYAAGEPYQE